MNHTYRIRIDMKLDEEGELLPVYGIEVYRPSEERPLPEYSIPDLFTDRGKAEGLVDLCNRLELDPIHLAAVAEDSLC